MTEPTSPPPIPPKPGMPRGLRIALAIVLGGVASFVAFFICCTSSVLFALAASTSGPSGDAMFFGGLAIGGIAALAVFFFMVRAIWPKS